LIFTSKSKSTRKRTSASHRASKLRRASIVTPLKPTRKSTSAPIWRVFDVSAR
jgi:hypothetical protein